MTTSVVDPAMLAEFVDRAAIRDVLARYCRAADRCDEQLMTSCYHEDAGDRHGPYSGSAAGFAAWVIPRLRTTALMTQHAISNVVIDFDRTGRLAWVESVFMATHVRPPTEADAQPYIETFWGRYLDRFEQRDGRWAIASREVVHDWSERRDCGPLMPSVETYRPGLRSRDDPSYERATAD